ncbi:MAG: hypothetical protein Q9M16_06435 [Mariprofundus sp.]|nr:hypothetical protein [Mariprofundus sp.]
MEATALTPFLNEWLGLMIDVALIGGFFCLWLTWYRNGKRQQKMEQLLIGTAKQLEEATMHLSLATSAIEELQQQKNAIPSNIQEASPQQPIEPSPPVAARESEQSHHTQPLLPQNSTQATMILRMQREGESETAIADRLDIPLAQVKLMLKLHAASNPGPSLNSNLI